MVMRIKVLSIIQFIFFIFISGFVLVGQIVLHVSFHGTAMLAGVDSWGRGALMAVPISIVVFAITRRTVLWGDPPPRLSGKAARKSLWFVALAGVVSSFVALYAKTFVPAGVWQFNRISKSGNDYHVYIDGVRRLASALDYEMQTRSMQLVPLEGALFLAGGFLAYVAVEWLEPGFLFRAIFAPWRLKANKDRRSSDLDEFGAWD